MTVTSNSNDHKVPQTVLFPKTASAFGWMIILMVFFVGFAGAIVGAGSTVRLVFPAISLLAAVYLYFKHSLLYVGFTWWIWCLTPLIRRLCDFYSVPDPSGVILLTPYLVTFVCVISLITFLPSINLSYRDGLPFVLAAASITYAFITGIIQNPPIAVFRAFLDWIVPILFGFYLFVNWKKYTYFRKNTQNIFLSLTLVTGLYGIFQFITAPKWDVLWLEITKIISMGNPEPFGLRVWSTLHSPSPFATLMTATLLISAITLSKWSIPISIIGYFALLLTFVRSAWGGWLVGLVALIISLKSHFQLRLFAILLAIVLILIPLATLKEDIRKPLTERFETFSTLKQDVSFNARTNNYEDQLGIALTRVIGRGMGSSFIVNPLTGKVESMHLDSGVLDSFFTLGWVGGSLYLGSLFILFYKCFFGKNLKLDPFAIAARSISLAILSQIVLSSLMIGFSGMLMWGMLGMCLASKENLRNL